MENDDGSLRRSKPLARPRDREWLSGQLCTLRAQIEAFAATPEDVGARAKRGAGIITGKLGVGRVGIRCVHCAHLPPASRARGSVSYPSSVRGVHQAVRNFQRHHFPVCDEIPAGIKEEFRELQGQKTQSKKNTAAYWVECCRRMGMVDSDDGNDGIRLASDSGAFRSDDEDDVNDDSNDNTQMMDASANELDNPPGAGSNQRGHESPDDLEPTPLPPFGGSSAAMVANNTTIPPIPAGDLDIPASDLPDTMPTSASDLPIFTPEDERAELASLTIKEMTLASKDLHGTIRGMGNLRVSGEENDDDCKRADAVDIIRLEAELEALPATKKAAYLQARHKCPQFLTQDHKISFLERENLDAQRAARRMVLYWDFRYKTFGPELCYLPMTLNGAMKNEVKGMMKHCALCILPGTDLKGRGIIFFDSARRDYERFSPEREARVMFYLLHTLAANPASRRAGFVIVANARHSSRQNVFFKIGMHMMNGTANAQPIKMRSMHMFHPSSFFVFVLSPIIKAVLGKELRLRFKMHYGNEGNVLANLEKYGLPRDRLPREVGGDLVLSFPQLVVDQGVKEAMAALEEKEGKDGAEENEELPKKRRKAATC